MTRLFALSALIPALMTSTALAADVLAEPVVVDEAPVFTLTGTAGIIAFDMPDFDTGVFGITDDSLAWGGLIGLSGSGAVSSYNDWEVILGFNVFGAFAGGSSSATQSFDDDSSVVITGLSAPTGGSIDLVAGDLPGPITSTVNGNLTSSAADGDGVLDGNVAFSSIWGAQGLQMGVVTTNAGNTNNVAAGGIADETGGVFAAVGDLSGLEVTTDVDRDIFYGGGELTIGLGGGSIGDGTTGVVYIGPSYRGLFQSNTTTVTANMAESPSGPATVTLPEFSISTADDIDSHYFGGVLGGNMAFGAGDGVVFTLGLEGGVYGVHASWTGQDTYETSGGFIDTDGDGPLPGSTQPPLSVTGPEFSGDFEDNIAFAARGNAAVTWAVNETTAFSLGGSIEYLSAVATVDHASRTTVTAGTTTADWAPGGADPVDSDEFSWGSMVNFAITASLTGQF